MSNLFKRMLDKAGELMLEQEEEAPASQADVSLEEATQDSQNVDFGDMDIAKMTEEMMKDALGELAEVDPEDSVYKVNDCISVLGGECKPETVMKMLAQVAKKDVDALRKDGESRVSSLKKLKEATQKNIQSTREEFVNEDAAIAKQQQAARAQCEEDVAALRKQCEEKILRMQNTLEADIQSLRQQTQETVDVLSEKRKENEENKKKAEALATNVCNEVDSQVAEITKLLEKITVQ